MMRSKRGGRTPPHETSGEPPKQRSHKRSN
jgi:hypothetical protein